MEEKTKNEKRMVQVGVTLHFDPKDKTKKVIKEEPIYAEWTPEIQARHDQAIDSFARYIYGEMQKYIANGGDLSKLDTPEGQEHYKAYRQKQIDEQKRKAELRKVKNKMTDEEFEEFLKWKESRNK